MPGIIAGLLNQYLSLKTFAKKLLYDAAPGKIGRKNNKYPEISKKGI